MNPTQQKSKITSEIFKKVDELKVWTDKLEQTKIDCASLNETLNKERDEYFRLDKGYDSYKKIIDDKKEFLNIELEQLARQISDYQDRIMNLGNKLLEDSLFYSDKIEELERLEVKNIDKVSRTRQEINTLLETKDMVMSNIEDLRKKNQYLLVTFGNLSKKIAEEEKKIEDMEYFIADIRKREQDIVLRETRVFEKEKKLKQK